MRAATGPAGTGAIAPTPRGGRTLLGGAAGFGSQPGPTVRLAIDVGKVAFFLRLALRKGARALPSRRPRTDLGQRI